MVYQKNNDLRLSDILPTILCFEMFRYVRRSNVLSAIHVASLRLVREIKMNNGDERVWFEDAPRGRENAIRA